MTRQPPIPFPGKSASSPISHPLDIRLDQTDYPAPAPSARNTSGLSAEAANGLTPFNANMPTFLACQGHPHPHSPARICRRCRPRGSAPTPFFFFLLPLFGFSPHPISLTKNSTLPRVRDHAASQQATRNGLPKRTTTPPQAFLDNVRYGHPNRVRSDCEWGSTPCTSSARLVRFDQTGCQKPVRVQSHASSAWRPGIQASRPASPLPQPGTSPPLDQTSCLYGNHGSPNKKKAWHGGVRLFSPST